MPRGRPRKTVVETEPIGDPREFAMNAARDTRPDQSPELPPMPTFNALPPVAIDNPTTDELEAREHAEKEARRGMPADPADTRNRILRTLDICKPFPVRFSSEEDPRHRYLHVRIQDPRSRKVGDAYIGYDFFRGLSNAKDRGRWARSVILDALAAAS